MLVELLVENFAVVEKLRLRLHPGLNVLTGETGSGKSLVVDALGLLFGGRASTETIRTGAPRAYVAGIFELPEQDALTRCLAEAGIEPENGELLLEREIQSSGKSRAFAGGRPVTAALLKDLAPFLGDIHGQHDQQRLFDGAAQRELLDEAGGDGELLERVAGSFHSWRSTERALEDLNRSEQEKLRMLDLWGMQRKEIDTLGLAPEEDAGLENEKRVLRNVTALQENAQAAYSALSEDPSSATTTIRAALKRLEALARIDETIAPLVESLRPAQIAVDDAAHELRHYLGKLEADPARLEEVEGRLAAIDKLKRKYGSTLEEILRFLEQVKANIAAVETSGERRQALLAEARRLEQEYRDLAEKLRASRLKTARKLEKQVETELASLAMAKSVFRIALAEAEPSESGMDAVTFLVSANVGEEPRPLDKVASGGELSRIALALKTCSAVKPRKERARTLVFDEVDAGVGGAAAETVGRRLKQIAAANQVLCVTHLTQIAGFADHHYLVSKQESGGRTVSSVEELGAKERVQEIGRMLSGQKLSPEALRHAEKLLAEYARAK
jgi:DNA repair protein RecN (Recombination protein N)